MIKPIIAAMVLASISGAALADDSGVNFVAIIPHGTNLASPLYKDKTYNFSYCNDQKCAAQTSIGSVSEMADGTLSQPAFSPLQLQRPDEYPIWIVVDVSDGVSAAKIAASNEPTLEGHYISNVPFFTINNKLTVTFDPVAAPTHWIKS